MLRTLSGALIGFGIILELFGAAISKKIVGDVQTPQKWKIEDFWRHIEQPITGKVQSFQF